MIIHTFFSCCWELLTLIQGLLSFSYCLTSNKAGSAQETGRGHTRTDDPNWPKRCSMPYDVMLKKKKLGGWGGELLLRDCLGISQLVESNFIVHHLFYLHIYICMYVCIMHIYIFWYYYFPFLLCLIKLSICQPMNFMGFTFFPFLSPHPTVEVRSERTALWCLNSCQMKTQQTYFKTKQNKTYFYYFLWILVLTVL